MIRYANQPIDDITNTTSLSQQVGLCYYDPIDETLKEFNTIKEGCDYFELNYHRELARIGRSYKTAQFKKVTPIKGISEDI